MRKILAIVCVILFLTIRVNVAQTQRKQTDPLTQSIIKVKDMLVKHYKPRLPGQNGLPAIDGRFVPIEFETCKIKWNLVAKSGKLTFTTQQSLDLADLDPTPPLVLMSAMPRTDRWSFELRTVNEERKITGKWTLTEGSKIRDRRQYLLSRTAFGAYSQEVTQEIADQVISLIKQCAQRRASVEPLVLQLSDEGCHYCNGSVVK